MSKPKDDAKRRFSLFKSFKLEPKVKSDLAEIPQKTTLKRANARSLSFKLKTEESITDSTKLNPNYRCAFLGGGGSNGCVVSGPYGTKNMLKYAYLEEKII